MLDESSDPQVGQSETPVAPPTPPEGGQAKVEAVPTSLPEGLQGKSAEDIAKMYVSLEKKLGEQSAEVGRAREFQEKVDVVLQAIWSNPELYKQVEGEITKLNGASSDTQTRPTEAPTVARDDTRRALENTLITRFEEKYGIDRLSVEDRRNMHVKVGNTLAELLDPGGSKSYQEILQSVSLDKLPKFLEHAYFIANKESLIERSKLEALTQARINESASIGSLPSSGGVSESETLTPADRAVAQKLGISEDKFLKRKIEISQERR